MRGTRGAIEAGQKMVMRIRSGVLLLSLAVITPAFAQDHTVIALSHSNHTVYEVDPATGKILNEFVARDQPHEAAITSDGATIFTSIPMAAFVEILDAKTFKQKVS
jgi:hypothetical protein